MVRKVGALFVLCFLLMACSGSEQEETMYELPTPSKVSRLTIAEERRQDLTLLLSIYDLLTKEFGVGEWMPHHVHAQIENNVSIKCPKNYASESYRLAVAGPLTDENWRAALRRIYDLARPYGFRSPQPEIHGTKGNAATLNSPIGSQIYISYNKTTHIHIDSGCARGELFEDWPAGTEVIPQRLRTTGRYESYSTPETWASEEKPSNPSSTDGT